MTSYFRLTTTDPIQQAIADLSEVAGGYEAVERVESVLRDVSEPPGFRHDVHALQRELEPPPGPPQAAAEMIKLLQVAQASEGPVRDGLLQLGALALRRLGPAAAAQALSVMLLACERTPSLTVVALRLCGQLARDEAGRTVLERVPLSYWRRALSAAGQDAAGELRGLTEQWGQRASDWLADLLNTTRGQASQAIAAGENLLARIRDSIEPKP